jgi:excisionase family DNA binding protein
MTLKEVAEYLRVNDRTVLKLASEGALPGARVGNLWRFRLGAIEAWLEDQMIGIPAPQAGPAAQVPPGRSVLSLATCFAPDHILLDLAATTADEVIGELVGFGHQLGLVRDPTRFATAIREREGLMSTATPHGSAFLHTLRRMPELVARPFMVMGRSHVGIGFGGADGKPTRIFFLLGLKYERLHLGWMSRLTWMLTRPEDVQAVLEAPDQTSVYALLSHAESGLQPAPAEALGGRGSAPRSSP